MKYVCLVCFVLVTAFHLYASIRQDTRKRNLSKPFIILFLLGFYVLGARQISVFIVLALVFSWLGDVLLMFRGTKWFVSGGMSFLASHVFLVLGFLKDIVFSGIPVIVIILPAAFFTAAVTFIFIKLKPCLPEALFYPMFLYLLVNGGMNCFAIFRGISLASLPGIITAAGAFLFFLSDTYLFFVLFYKNSPIKSHFPVMLTYCIGELLIVQGLL